MWELIRANRRKSITLFMCMGLCLVVLGYVIGRAFDPSGSSYAGGIFVALGIWVFLSVLSIFAGDRMVLTISKAKEVNHDVHPQLFNVVEEMKISAGLPAMPRIYIINDPALNAFATGMKIENSAIAVTAGLLSKLNRDELQGVIAHEMSHIVNRDVQFMTFAGVLLGSIVLLSEIFLRSMFYSSSQSRRYRSGGRSGGQAQVVFLVLAVVLAVFAPVFARLLYFAISRKREYLADASAVRLTRYPLGLAAALEKISGSSAVLASANTATAPMYISNPLKKKKKAVNLGSTHPPIAERIRILKAMMSGAGYGNYQQAYSSIMGAETVIMPASALNEEKKIEIRKPVHAERKTEGSGSRTLGDLMMAVNSYAFITCLCGIKIKIPRGFKKKNIHCPRCRREHKVPVAQLASAVAVAGAVAKNTGDPSAGRAPSDYSYKRKGRGWESLNCDCGRLIQISPSFESSDITCSNCGKKIKIVQNSSGG